jgi:hypothetical protein
VEKGGRPEFECLSNIHQTFLYGVSDTVIIKKKDIANALI